MSDATEMHFDAAKLRSLDESEFTNLFKALAPRIYTLARRLTEGDSDDAEEVVLDTFTKLVTLVDRLPEEPSRLYAFVHRLAVNVALHRRRRIADRGRIRSIGVDEVPDPTSTDVSLRVTLESAINALPEGARKVFVLHDVEGYNHQEIAEMLELSSGTIKSQLHRARRLLRDALDQSSVNVNIGEA